MWHIYSVKYSISLIELLLKIMDTIATWKMLDFSLTIFIKDKLIDKDPNTKRIAFVF